ncbi:MAG TPA: fibronectin type III domain-containing protein, partial [Tepidisphaeraceae bacterium]|nr:fibronectin type III domain-containing protein [Tepidisphaeraceae bacterium]
TCPLSRSASATQIFVSPTGDDSNDASAAHPIRNLQHARDLVRRINQNMTADIFVYLAPGTYGMGEPLVLDAGDSGSNGHSVIWTSKEKERAVISGGGRVTGWKLVDPAKNLWSAPAPAELKNTRQLYVDGVRALRARGRLPVKLTQTSTGYIADQPIMAHWRNAADIEFVYMGGNTLWSEHSSGLGAWTEPRCPVASINGTTITLAQPCWDNSTRRVMMPRESGFKRTVNLVGPASVGRQPEYVENAFELLGTPGQWYFDRTERRIYYVPRDGEDLTNADVEVPILDTLIRGEGTAAKPIHNITFDNLQFSYATWLRPSTPEGFSEIQANYCITGPEGYATQGLCDFTPGGTCPYGNWTKTPGNISFECDHDIHFTGDAFVHLGAAGLELGDGTQEALVDLCNFTDISGSGIELGGVDLPLGTGNQICRDNSILNNHIYSVAVEYHGGVGICVGYAQDSIIAFNQLDHLPYTGISIGWGGWPDKIHKPGQANNSRNNRIEHNLIFDHMLVLADGGGIYTQGLTGANLTEGEKLTGNVIFNQYGSGHGIYTDNGCANVTARSNVIFNTNHDNWGSRHANYYDGKDGKTYDPFEFSGNFWQQGNADSSVRNVMLKNNRLIDSLDQVPQAILQRAGMWPDSKAVVLSQVFVRHAAPEPPSRVSVAPGDGFALVAWCPPIFQGSSPVRAYTVSARGGPSVSVTADDYAAKAFVKLPGLTNGKPYEIVVTAIDADGTSPPSLPSLPVTPRNDPIQKPDAPGKVSALAGDGMASIHFQAPPATGGGPILGYTVTTHPGQRIVTFTGRRFLTLDARHSTFGVISGLKSGTPYTFDIAAVNAAGAGEPAHTRPVTPQEQEK